MSKYVLQLDVRGSSVPLDTIEDHLPGADDDRVWSDERRVNRGEDEDGVPYLSAHVPFNHEDDARDLHGELGALNGVLNSADSGYIHVHECPTSGSEEAWDCSDRVVLEIRADE